MTESRFRQFLVLYVLLELIAIALGHLPNGYSTSLAEAYSNEPEPWLFQHTWLFIGSVALLVVAGIAGLIGLYFFRAWARALSVCVTLATLAFMPFTGPTLYSALEQPPSEAASTVWGVILALAFWSAVSDRFRAN
jgi:hypothetical protein